MKRPQTLITVLFTLPLFIYAQDEGFFTRNLLGSEPKESSIECWRASDTSINPVRIAVVQYKPSQVAFLQWSVQGPYFIDYGWDYTFIGWLVEESHPLDTLFSDYTPWTYYDQGVCDTFDLILQYETTRPTMPPR